MGFAVHTCTLTGKDQVLDFFLLLISSPCSSLHIFCPCDMKLNEPQNIIYWTRDESNQNILFFSFKKEKTL